MNNYSSQDGHRGRPIKRLLLLIHLYFCLLQPPKKFPAPSQLFKIQQVIWDTLVESSIVPPDNCIPSALWLYLTDLFHHQDKPLPPSRPLPPLAAPKPVNTMFFVFFKCLDVHVMQFLLFLKCEHLLSKIMKPKPPIPPVKPKPSAGPSPLPHTQLVCIPKSLRDNRTFLSPPNSGSWHSNIPDVIWVIHIFTDVCGVWTLSRHYRLMSRRWLGVSKEAH